MATRNRTILFRRYRDALKSVRVPAGSSPSSSGGRAVIELSTTSLLNPNQSYTPLSTEDPGTSRYFHPTGNFISSVLSAFASCFSIFLDLVLNYVLRSI